VTYIGQQPSSTFDSGIQDRFTGLTTNTVTLTHDISAETDILVVWNNIVQDSGTYSVGGTGNKTLTLGGTLVSADIVTVYYTNRVMQSVNPTAGSVTTTTINDGAVTNDKLAGSISNSKLATPSIAGTESFFVRKTSSAQNISHNTQTLITFNTADINTNTNWSSANNRYVIPSNGTYLIFVAIKADSSSSNDIRGLVTQVRTNGVESTAFVATDLKAGYITGTEVHTQDCQISFSFLKTFSASDYVDVYCSVKTGTGGTSGRIQAGDGYNSFFGGFKIA